MESFHSKHVYSKHVLESALQVCFSCALVGCKEEASDESIQWSAKWSYIYTPYKKS